MKTSRKSKHRLFTLIAALILSQAAQLSYAADEAAGASGLAARWAELRKEQPRLQIRDAAAKLKVSEAELLASQIGQGVTRLQNDEHTFREIMRRALDLGQVMATTRNEHGVLERTGTAMRLKSLQDEQAQALTPENAREREERLRNIAGGYLGGEIDLRFHFLDWKYAFAVVQPGRDGNISRSLQFFDAYGQSVHKLYLRNEASIAVYDKLVQDFRHPQQQLALQIQGALPALATKPDQEVDVKEFQLAWKEMSDVHQFNQIVREFGLNREQAFRLAPAGMAQKVSPAALRTLLDQAAQQQISIMAFLGNTGVTQIFSGKIEKTAASGEWYNVLDPAFNLHIRESALMQGWVLQRAGVTSVEFFDRDGKLVVSFFGVRERAKPQPASWIALAAALPRAAQ
ncbi:hemin-degrading factor [Undibacterium curvum]|uniref:Hemin-degrading factor n=1 Tax=Undibacterium curvum TaxID=2762294 RepID=A0ABR7A9X3_9BURK|nr:ChuX/HutX family heme-like substrate-binding protein [Undibacterium curvum]MBC3933679.1 hemin-degrading factor [Undibacterium curvum]